MKKSRTMPCAASVAGSDSGGGAGIQADMLAMAANGVFATSVVAAITAQNPSGVRAAAAVQPRVFAAQLEAVFSYFKPAAAKTGMLFDAEHIGIASEFFKKNKGVKLVADPVMVSTSGAKLLRDDAVRALETLLLPEAFLITPNIDEAAVLLGESVGAANIEAAAARLSKKFSTAVLLKGGHLGGGEIADILCEPGGGVCRFESERVEGVNTHGSGCTLSAAIAANLAKGLNLRQACLKARQYLLAGMRSPLRIAGEKFINHFPNLK